MKSKKRGQTLRWQSWTVLAAVAPCCAIAVLWRAMSSWDGNARISLGISVALALAVWSARAATPAAALLGGLVCAALTLAPLGGSWLQGLPALVTLFVLTFVATRFGRSRKQEMGLAEDKRGRNAAQVAANLGFAGLGAAAALSFSSQNSWWPVMVVAALAEATADTLSSELGQVLGGQPILVTTLQPVEPGTDGGVSLSGTLAGIGGAVVLVLVGEMSLGLGLRPALCAGFGAVGGLFFDSLLGATVERSGWLNNDAVNFISTAVAAIMAWILFAWLV